mgnify:CR=1 FL=1
MKRRTFVGVAAAGLPALSILGAGSARAQVKEIRMIEAGGKSGESVEVGYIEPFTKKTGIKVIRESPNPLGKLRSATGIDRLRILAPDEASGHGTALAAGTQ